MLFIFLYENGLNLNDNSFNPVGTRFGTDLFPYKRSGLYYDYKSKNPFSIYKGSTPYLYLTRYSGIELRGQYDPAVDRGLVVPINSSTAVSLVTFFFTTTLPLYKLIFPGPVPT